MKECNACGNEYDKPFLVQHNGEEYVFDSLQCAIHTLAPECTQCSIKIIGHGVESNNNVFCCAHCASAHGVTGIRDRVEHMEGQRSSVSAGQ